MLMGRYNAMPVIPIDTVVKDYFGHLTPTKFLRKISEGSIRLPLVRMENSQKSARGVNMLDLASYIDERTDEARRECNALHS
ncbi:pyocin activator PrtN family protein [Loktanella salsilacus]|uniref:pyocin activator PrtN family protein n=1 Tax=Loktanella salsilacus TaxID=195913 RepID=UPI00356B43C2